MTVHHWKLIITYFKHARKDMEFTADSLAEARAVAYQYMNRSVREAKLYKLDRYTFNTVGYMYWDFVKDCVVWSEREQFAHSRDAKQYRLITYSGNIKGIPYWIPRIIP